MVRPCIAINGVEFAFGWCGQWAHISCVSDGRGREKFSHSTKCLFSDRMAEPENQEKPAKSNRERERTVGGGADTPKEGFLR